MPVIVTSSNSPDNIYKIILIGDERTGKSNLFERLGEYGKWDSAIPPTIGVNFLKRTIKISDWPMILQIWDIAADKRMEAVWRACFRKTYAVFLVYDITNKKSFLRIEDWLSKFREVDDLVAQIVLVGNKCDLEDQREVSYEEARLLAEERCWKFVEVSAKTLENVNHLARLIATDLFNRYITIDEPEPPRKISRLYEDKSQDGDVIKLKEKNEEKKKSVCAT